MQLNSWLNGTTRAVLIGSTAGAGGALSMELFQTVLKHSSPEGHAWVQRSIGSTHHPQTSRRQAEEKANPRREPSTARAVNRLSIALTHRRLPHAALVMASEAMHYTTGIIPAIPYAFWRGNRPFSLLTGAAFGTLVFVLLNQWAVPAMGLVPQQTAHRPRNQIFGLIAHLLYGTTTEAVRSLMVAA